MSTENTVQGTEAQTVVAEDKPKAEQVTCFQCKRQFDYNPEHVWVVELKVIEKMLKRWARPDELKRDHALCGKCGHMLREAGHKTYRLSATLKLMADRKAQADAKREQEEEERAAARRATLTATLADKYAIDVSTGEQVRDGKGHFTGDRKVKQVRVERKKDPRAPRDPQSLDPRNAK